MSNNGNNEKRRLPDAAKILLGALAVYSAVSFAILLIWKKLPPAPLGEYQAFAYILGKAGKNLPALIIAALWLLSVVLCAVTVLSRRESGLPFKSVLTVLILADLVLHVYAFLTPSASIPWSYLVSATLDGAMVFCVLAGGKKKK